MSKKIKIAIFLGVLGLLFWATGVLFQNPKNSESDKEEYREEESAKGAASYWAMRRGGVENTSEFNQKLAEIRRQLSQKFQTKSSSMQWEELGPDNVGGRTRALLIDNDNSNRIYAGGVSGGLWFSDNAGLTWNPTSPGDNSEVLTVTCITQDPDGYIYYGTGEGSFYQEYGNGTGGFRGQGLFKSTQPHGTEFIQLTGSLTNAFNQPYNSINELASDNNGVLYAGAEQGIHRSLDGGISWEPLFSGVQSFRVGWDVKVDSQNRVYAVLGTNIFKSSTGDPLSFIQLSGSGGLPASEGRTELAIAPSDDNYIYAISSDDGNSNKLQGIWRSIDGGSNWETLISGSSEVFDPFTTGNGSFGQGTYNNVIAVFPDNKDKVLVGGVTFWQWENGGNWERIASTSDERDIDNYVHVDMHAIAFTPGNSERIYVGTDGGIFRSDDGGERWQRMNRKYNVTQFYAVGFDAEAPVIGGTQDNSTPYLNYSAISPQNAVIHNSGDGGYAEISSLNPDRMFVESQYGRIVRSSNGGSSYSEFFEYAGSNNNGNFDDYNPNFAPFVAPFLLWETQDNEIIQDTLKLITEEDLNIGDTVNFLSDLDGRVLDSVLTIPVNSGTEMTRIDPFQSVFIFGTNEGVYLTRDAHDFTKTPSWLKIASAGTSYSNGRGVTCFSISNDGNTLYYGTTEGRLYRVDSLLYASESFEQLPTTQLASFSAAVTGLSCDPNNSDELLITIGSYSNITHVYHTTIATQITTSSLSNFDDVQGDLPNFPVYDALIEKDGNGWLLATEFGVYFSNNSGVTWGPAGDFPNVPTLMVRQQTNAWAQNHGFVYVATHGRGLFRSSTYQLPVSASKIETKDKKEILSVFPNPAKVGGQINLKIKEEAFGKTRNINLFVYDLNGKLVMHRSIHNQVNFQLPNNILPGLYMIQVNQLDRSYWSKFIVR
jgi:ligand-binding sensor domain-containing protein